MSNPVDLTTKINNIDEQRELFLWKYRDVSREDVAVLLKDFQKHDKGNKGELEYDECMMLLEYRGVVKTGKEIMDLVKSMDQDGNHRINFLEFCCAFYEKSYDGMFIFVDEEARERAMEEVRNLAEEARRAQEQIELAKRQKELQAQIRAEAIERESKLSGVAGMRAFFARKVEGATDTSKTNEQQIKEEALRRRQLREAKAKMQEALENANKVKSAEEVALEVQRAAEKAAAEEAAALKKKEEEEKAARAARKAALNAKWSNFNNINATAQDYN